MPHHVRVVPVVVVRFEPAAGCRVRRVVAYRAVCSCGWRGSSRGSVAAARPDAGEHLAAEAG